MPRGTVKNTGNNTSKPELNPSMSKKNEENKKTGPEPRTSTSKEKQECVQPPLKKTMPSDNKQQTKDEHIIEKDPSINPQPNVTKCTCITTEVLDQIIKQKMSEMFKERFETLKDNMVTVMASKISGLIEENNNLRLEIQQIKDTRETEKRELSVVHQLVKTFNTKLSEVDKKQENVIQEVNNKVQSINDNVLTMLDEIPQVTSIEDRFSTIEETLSSFAESRESTGRLGSTPFYESNSNISSCSHDELMLAVTNEVDQRQKRRKSLVIHNVEEADHKTEDFAKVRDILQQVVKEESMVDQQLSNMYRLGKEAPGRIRTIKLHFNSEDFCQSILQNTRKLRTSKSYRDIVIQADLTPLQRSHLKSLVQEKRERNQYAVQCNEEPDWVIKNGKLCRKSEL